MDDFFWLIEKLDQSTKSLDKKRELKSFLLSHSDQENMIMLAILSGQRPYPKISTKLMREYFFEVTEMRSWLFEECYSVVGDLAETLALLIQEHLSSIHSEEAENTTSWEDLDLTTFIEKHKQAISAEKTKLREWIFYCWKHCPPRYHWMLHKLWAGNFRIGVSKKFLMQALADIFDLDPQRVQQQMMGEFSVEGSFYRGLIQGDAQQSNPAAPYPFFLATNIDQRVSPIEENELKEWLFEWKWDGVRLQVVKRQSQCFLWSRGEELINDSFPDVASRLSDLPDGVVLDAELLPGAPDEVLDFQTLQKRLGRKRPSSKFQKDNPVFVMAFDLLELQGKDLRSYDLAIRKTKLRELESSLENSKELFQVSEAFSFNRWEEASKLRAKAREYQAEGMMIKKKKSTYQPGRVRGDWWKWKLDPLTFDGVLIYAQSGHGRRASLFTDYTLAVWDGEELVAVTKAYSGLSDQELKEVDRWIKKNTLDKFGPVRAVNAELVFEIAFENIWRSGRHKSGVAMRFPRIKRWRRDKTPEQADKLSTLQKLLRV